MPDRLFLNQVFKTSGLSPDDLQTVVNSFEQVSFKKKDYVLEEGRIANEYYFIESGFMRSFVRDTNGSDITTAFYSSSQLVLEVASFFLRIPTKENIQALTDCTCWKISFEEFQMLFHQMEGFREAGRKRLVNGYYFLKQKTLSMITETADVRYLQLLKEHPEVFKYAPLKNIATYLGITDTSLSRIRKELVKK
ncbi:MAG TPA: cyclic nucleotide-binding domain-containing protein [Pedobacter sp.]